MKQLVCIGCPRGCRLTIDEKDGEYIVTGNTCPRGKEFAISEMTAPKRTICSTVKTAFPDVPVLPGESVGRYSQGENIRRHA